MFYVYILSNRTGLLSAGVTRHIVEQLHQRQLEVPLGCAHQNHLDRLLLLESFRHSAVATARQTHLNQCTLTEKLELIRVANPRLNDLALTLAP